MKEAGILDVELQHAVPKPNVCEVDSFSKINILDVAPALILLALGMGLSILMLALEIVWYWRTQNYNQNMLTLVLNLQGLKNFKERYF